MDLKYNYIKIVPIRLMVVRGQFRHRYHPPHLFQSSPNKNYIFDQIKHDILVYVQRLKWEIVKMFEK